MSPEKTFTQALSIKNRKYCFDTVLRLKDDDIIIVKQLDDIEKLSPKIAENLKKISDFFEGLPIIIANKIQGEPLPDDIVYSKHYIPVMTEETYQKVLRGSEDPLIYVARGGIYVRIKKDKFKERREKKGISRGELAHLVGVSRKAIIYYESGDSDASLNIALRLEQIFGEEIFEKMSIKALKTMFRERLTSSEEFDTQVRDEVLRFILRLFSQLGFRKYLFHKTPFDAGAKSTRRKRIKIIIEREKSFDDVDIVGKLAEVTRAAALILSDKIEKEEISERYIIVPRKNIGKILDNLRRHLVEYRDEEYPWGG